jgi:tetratricopeptide (TPR) repeat protein
LAALDRRAAVAALAELAGAHLVDERVPGRFGMHDLLRAYAAELSTRDDTDADRHAAIDRAFRHYLLSLDAADRVRYPGCPPLRTPAEQPGIDAERFADPGEALQWCQRQRPALAALIGRAAQDGPATYMAEGRWSLWLYFHLWGHWADLGEARRVVLTTTRAIDESRPEPEPVPGDHTFAQARDHYRRLVELGQRRGEDSTAAYCLFGLTQMLARQGRPTEALTFAGHAVDWFSRSGDRAGIALALNQIGHYQVRMGLAAEAERNCRQALALGRELGDQLGAASAETTLGQLAQLRGELAEAGRHYASAATGFRAAGERDGRRQALTQLGDIRRALGDPAGAARSWQAALDLLAGPDHPHAADLRDRLRSLRRRPLPGGST